MATKRSPKLSAASDAALSKQASAAVAHLQSVGVNFLALDFDETILGIHTGGQWKHSLEELLPNVRPVFKHLIRNVVATQNDATSTDSGKPQPVYVAVVTYTPQVDLVRGVLADIFGGDYDVASTIPIRGNDRSWEYKGVGSTKGKQPHMASAAEELRVLAGEDSGIQFTRASTLLVDDDPRNIRAALKDKTKAIWFNPHNDAGELYDAIMKL